MQKAEWKDLITLSIPIKRCSTLINSGGGIKLSTIFYLHKSHTYDTFMDSRGNLPLNAAQCKYSHAFSTPAVQSTKQKSAHVHLSTKNSTSPQCFQKMMMVLHRYSELQRPKNLCIQS